MAELVQDWFTRRLAGKDAWRNQFRPAGPEDADQQLRIAESRADGAMELLRFNDTGAAAETVEALLEEHGVTAAAGDPVLDDLRRGILRAEAEAARIHAARMRGDFTVRPADPLLAKALDIESAPGKTPPKFNEAWKRFVGEKIKSGAWRDDMRRENANTHGLFVEWCGDKRVDRYARSDISDFAGMLQALPALRGKSPKLTGKTLAELVAMTKADATIDTLSPKSVKKHTSNLSSFFGWLVEQGYITDNPARGVYKFKRTVRRQDECDAWSVDQLKKLFSSPVYHGCLSEFYRARPGELVIRDARYWLPILGAFHPVRLEEVAQLRVEDVQREGRRDFTRTKSKSARRLAAYPSRVKTQSET